MSSNVENSMESFRVFIRIRPLNEKEKLSNQSTNISKHLNFKNTKPSSILITEENLLFVLDPDSTELNGRKEKSFAFDKIFSELNTNKEIFDSVIKGMVDNVLLGYNATALAYGVTGTG